MYKRFEQAFGWRIKGDFKQWYEKIPTEDVWAWFLGTEEAVEHRVQRIAFGAFLAGFFAGGILMLAVVSFYFGVR